MKVKNWTPVSSASAMPGKKVSAQVVENVVVNGQVVVPRKSVLSGHIIEAQKKDTIHSEARLRIVYDSIRVRGKKMAFTGLIEKVSVEDSPPEEVTESDCFTAPPSNPFPDRSDPLPSSSSQHCMTRSYISSDPTSGDDISFAGFVDDNTGQGVVIVSERNIRISWQTRFTVRVASPPHVVN